MEGLLTTNINILFSTVPVCLAVAAPDIQRPSSDADISTIVVVACVLLIVIIIIVVAVVAIVLRRRRRRRKGLHAFNELTATF